MSEAAALRGEWAAEPVAREMRPGEDRTMTMGAEAVGDEEAPRAGVLSDAALDSLLRGGGVGGGAGAGAEGGEADAELWVERLGERAARLDALNVGGMLAAATGGGARLAARLADAHAAGLRLRERRARLEEPARGAPDAVHARCGAARADTNARALLRELTDLYRWLDAPPLADLDRLAEMSLATAEGRARALAAADALRAALRAEGGASAARRRLGAVRERLRRLARARDALAAAVGRHLNNLLIHLGNEAAAAPPAPPAAPPRHRAELLPYAPFMRWLKDMDEKAYEALVKLYAGTWARLYERELRAACEAARGAPAAEDAGGAEAAPAPGAGAATGAGAGPQRADDHLDKVLTLVESMCNAEQDFCAQFFHLDVDLKGEGGEGGEGGDGERSEGGGGEGARRGAGAEARRLMGELFPTLEQELLALVAHLDHADPYGAMRALACVGRRVLGAGGAEGEARWARAALAAAAVAAKRGADRAVADRIAALPDAVKQAARRPKCGLLSFLREFEELSETCERIFAGGRRADLERWYAALAGAMLRAVLAAEHPRTPRAVVRLENCHRLHALLAALRVPQLEALRRECRARYAEALRQYVTQYFGRPLEKLTQFFEGVSEAVAAGVREDEVCYRAAFSKHELRRLLALYPAAEVRRSLHRLYRTVEKHLSEEGGLLQVVWRAMQEELIAQHVALQARLAASYPAAGLAMPLTTQDILDAFSDIAREH